MTKNALVGGRRRVVWTALGVACSNAVQGSAAAAGLGAMIVRAQPLFQAIKWAGVAYLVFLGAQALRSATGGQYAPLNGGAEPRGAAVALGGWRQGFLSNITNPKVLVFYLAVLPQFLVRGAGIPELMLFALSHAVLGLLYLLVLVASLYRARRFLARRAVRRSLDGLTGLALVGFSARLAAEQA